MPSKSFKSNIAPVNPAMRFISGTEENVTEPAYEPVNEKLTDTTENTVPDKRAGFKANPAYIETRSRRMQLLLQPSLYEKIKTQASAAGVSVNELVHELLEKAVLD